MLLLTALLAAWPAVAQQYIITNGTYYLTHDATSGAVSTAGVTEFSPATCLWSISGNYIRPVDENGNVLGSLYLRPRANNNNYSLNTNISTNYATWNDVADGGQPYYNRYLRWSGSNNAWQIANNTSERGTLHLVTKETVAVNQPATYSGTLSGTTALVGAGATSTVTPSATRTESYTATTTTYSYSGGTLGSTTTGTVPTPTAVSLASGWTLSWSLSDDTYATISNNGVVTVGSTLPTTYATTTVTLTATRTDGTGSFTATMPLTIYASADVRENVVGGTQGISGGIVTLNDYEDHSWSYYSDASLPARMRSLLPANVVIKYYGNGTNTVSTNTGNSPALNTFTASTDNSVAVGIGEPEDTFVYYKTLERTSGSAYGSATYNYTTIPNPFSIRPTYGTGDTRWRGFYAWRIKSVNGGTISGKAVGDIIDAEATVSFIPTAEYGMTVELEALWARAYVGSGLQASVGRERNFIIVSSDAGRTMDNVRVATPCTYSSFYPNGTTNGTTAATLANRATRRATFTATADSRIEYMLLNGNNYSMSANANSLTLGRGIGATGGTYSCYTFSAINANHSEDLDFTVRIESGVYHDVDLMAAGNTLEGRVHNHFFFGSDYDRARGDNSKLDVAPTETTEIHFATPKIDVVNKDKPVLDIVVKSGDYQKNRWYDNNESAYNQSFYCHSTENASYPGLVSMTVEGGHFANINGGRGTYTEGHITPDSLAFTMRFKGGIVENSIYGAASNNPTFGSRRMIFTGGEVKGWVVAGCNGTGDDNNAYVTGNSYIYVGGNTKIGNDTASRSNNGTPGGSVYGAGRGNNNHRASITNSHVAVADHADIMENVFGGGFHGYITDTSNVFILGGTVHGNVYGGGSENGDVSASIPRRIPNVNVIMTGGLVEGGVYGGSYTRGIVTDQVNMYINGGQVGTSSQRANVHGGGLGHETRVLGSVNVNVGTDCHATTGATIYGDVYGGSAEGRTNGDNSRNGSAVTNVNLYHGTIYGGLYGGGLGTATYPAYVYGPVAVKVFGGSVRTNDGSGENGSGGVFGCNNVNGTPMGTVDVDIYGTDPAEAGHEYALYAVYGGGNRSHYTGVPKVAVHGCDNRIEYVYGGGNASDVLGTNVTIWGGYIGNAFGGGNGYSEDGNHDNPSALHYNPGANITADGTNLTIHGGTVKAAFGGSNQWGTIDASINVSVRDSVEPGTNICTGTAFANCPIDITELYGGGNKAPVKKHDSTYIASSDITINITSCDAKIASLFGGAKEADYEGDISLTITQGQFQNVFGGNNLGGDIVGNVSLTLKGGTMVNAFGGNNQGGTISGTITVLVDSTGNECPLKVDNVYGGGNEAAYAPTTATATTPVVNVVNGTVRNAVFGGGLGAAAKITANPTVTIGGTGGKHAIVGGTRIDGTKGDGNVYGGGSQADVLKTVPGNGNTTVTLTGKATVKGNVYGGGNQADVQGNTNVELR